MRIKILLVREEKRCTLKRLSDKTGISIGALSNYESEKRSPSMEQMELIAKALKVGIQDLYDSEYK